MCKKISVMVSSPISVLSQLSSDQQEYYILRANYCARQDPRIMHYGPCFHRTGSGVVGLGYVLCQYGLRVGKMTAQWFRGQALESDTSGIGSWICHFLVRI